MINFNNYFLTEADNTTHVMTFMRANPPTIGHERVVNHVVDLANGLDAGHSIVLSHSHDGDKNPLTAEQKLRHAKIAFPNANVTTSSPDAPSLMYHATNLHKKGVKNLHLVVGQDRVDQFNKLLNQYNGVEGAHGYYNFDNIKVHSAGGRDPDAEGIEGVSGTGQRNHARLGNFEGFRAGAPSRMTDDQATALMNDIRSAKAPEKPIKPKTTKKKPSADFNPGTAVYVQHGSHSQEPVKESTRLSFKQLIEGKTKGNPYKNFIEDKNYLQARRNTIAPLDNANDHIAKGGSDEVHDILDKHYDLSKNPHSEHFDNYSDSSYAINASLFHHHNEGGAPNELPDEDINDISHDDITGLDKALNHKKTPKPMTVFSGVGFNPGMMAAQHPKKQLYMPSYTSTSIDPNVAADFARPLPKGNSGEDMKKYDPSDKNGADHHVLRINLPKGHPGSYIAGSSYHPDEKEFLLPRQQTMKINPKPEVQEFEHNGITHRMHIWDATPQPTKLPKPVTEEITSSGDGVRGFGDVTGNPAVQDNPMQQYIATNSLAKDRMNGALLRMMKDSQRNLIGFKEFRPNERSKSLKYYDADPNGEYLGNKRKK